MAATDSRIAQSWSAIQQFTETMQLAAEDAEWARVLELATQRHVQLLSHFEQFPVGPTNAEFYQQHLHAMLIGEQQLQAITTDARKAVMRDGLISSRNHRAMDAYLTQ
jgi:hypothetical protein